MKRETIVPSIPDIRADNATDVLRAIKSTMDVREGRIGDPLDQLVTVRDLTDIGLVVSGGTTRLTSGATVPVVVPGAGGDGYNPTEDYTTPPVPSGLTASAGFSNVYLSWNGAPYRNHAYTEIWRAETDNLGSAVKVGTSTSNLFADPAAEGTTYYYWIRFVSVADVTGPYNDTAGTAATTATDPGAMLDLLTGQITESQLYSSLGARINLIDAPATAAGSVSYRIAQEAAARASAIQNEADARAAAILSEAASRSNADASLQTQINTLVAASSGDLGDLLAAVQEEQTARTNADAAEAAARETLATQLRGSYSGTDPAVLSTGLIYNERQARVTAEGVISSQVSALSATVTGNYNTLNSAITSEQTARANADTTLTNSLNTLTSTVNTNYTTVNAAIASEQSTRASADTALANSITSLTSTVNGNYTTLNSAITAEQTARSSADATMAQSIQTLQSTSGSYDNGIAWNFDSGVEGFSSIQSLSLSASNGSLVVTATGFDPVLVTPTIALDGSKSYIVRVRIKRVSGTGWDGSLFYVTSGHGTSESYKGVLPTPVGNDWQILEYDMSNPYSGGTDWITNTITQIRFDFGNSAGDNFLVDWISVGRIAPQAYTALITQEATTRASADTALSTSITNLQSVVNTNAAALQTEQTTRATADGQLFAQYSVKVDLNGYVSGFGLSSTANNSTPLSSFIVRADSFAIASPSGPGIYPATPFIVRTTGTTINGEYVAPGVYMADAFIQNGTITSAKIGSLTADKITTGSLTAAISVNTGLIYGGVNTSGYAPGTSYFGTGFLMGSYQGAYQFFVGSPTQNMTWNGSSLTVKGVVYADAGSFAGTIYAGSGTIGGNTIASAGISSPGYSPGSSGWSLNSSGAVEFQNATVRGVIRSADGKFIIDTFNKYIRIEV